jgi:hypothetical protein
LRAANRRPVRGDAGLRLLARGIGIVVVLLAHRLDGDEVAVAIGLDAGDGEVGFGPRQRRLRTVEGRLIGRGVDLIERRAGSNVAALGEQSLLNQAADLRPYLGDAEFGWWRRRGRRNGGGM